MGPQLKAVCQAPVGPEQPAIRAAPCSPKECPGDFYCLGEAVGRISFEHDRIASGFRNLRDAASQECGELLIGGWNDEVSVVSLRAEKMVCSGARFLRNLREKESGANRHVECRRLDEKNPVRLNGNRGLRRDLSPHEAFE